MDQNLLIIISDEHQSKALGALGHFVETPHLDRLAARGTMFTSAYTPSPICVPARASFATGHYAHRNRLWDNAMPYTGEIPSWGHALQAGDVDVESIGKLHYRNAQDDTGFDALHLPMMVVDGVGMVWASIRDEQGRVSAPTRMLGPHIGAGESKYTSYDTAVTARARQWLADRARRERASPFASMSGWWRRISRWLPPKFMHATRRCRSPSPSSPQTPRTSATTLGSPCRTSRCLRKVNSRTPTNAGQRSPHTTLVSWLDHNVGQILDALDQAGLGESTTVIYASDHGDNVGARKLWGKSNFYEESAAVPMIAAGPGFAAGQRIATPVSLLDLSVTIPDVFGLSMLPSPLGPVPGRSLRALAAEPYDPERVVFSEYHAVGAVSGGFMVRRGDWKYIYYVGFEPELFNLADDPEEVHNRSGDPTLTEVQASLHEALLAICDPEVTNDLAFADQAALIALHGGREQALKLGAPGATPPPEV